MALYSQVNAGAEVSALGCGFKRDWCSWFNKNSRKRFWILALNSFWQINPDVLPRKLTRNLKMDPWKRRFLLETILFRFHVSFRGCKDSGVPTCFFFHALLGLYGFSGAQKKYVPPELGESKSKQLWAMKPRGFVFWDAQNLKHHKSKTQFWKMDGKMDGSWHFSPHDVRFSLKPEKITKSIMSIANPSGMMTSPRVSFRFAIDMQVLGFA